MKLAADIPASENGQAMVMYWMKTREAPKYEAGYQKVRC